MSEKVFTLRMDEELFEKVKISADKNKRSIAKEIEYHLEQSLEKNTVYMIEKIFDFVDDFNIDYHQYFDKIEEIHDIVKK